MSAPPLTHRMNLPPRLAPHASKTGGPLPPSLQARPKSVPPPGAIVTTGESANDASKESAPSSLMGRKPRQRYSKQEKQAALAAVASGKYATQKAAALAVGVDPSMLSYWVNHGTGASKGNGQRHAVGTAQTPAPAPILPPPPATPGAQFAGLDEVFDDLQKGIEHLTQAARKIDTFRQVLRRMFGG